MPVGNITGWDQVFADDFATFDTTKWWTWGGQPGGDPSAWWDASHVTVFDSVLTLSTSQGPFGNTGKTGWVSGGVGCQFSQTYGKYEVCMRADTAPGVSVICLLWPVAKVWPPEVDFYEDDGTRSAFSATLHYTPGNQQVQEHCSAYDLSKWHVVGVEWTADRLVYTVDGVVWQTLNNVNVPSIPMRLDMQAQYLGQGSPPTISGFDIDWVVQYKPAP